MKAKFQYQNPIIDSYLADPFILRSKDEYYLFATGKGVDGRCVPIYHSPDLVEWTFLRGAVACGDEGMWNRHNFWAPEVIEVDGKFYLYYTAASEHLPNNTENRVGLAVSDFPGGPYEDVGVVISHASLDGSPFRDVDGTMYLYYTVENGNKSGYTPGQIYVDKLVAPDCVAGNPALLVDEYKWQEGACMLERDGRYFLSFSLGSWTGDGYSVHWREGSSPTGPFEKNSGVLLQSTDQVKGPGHHNLFADHTGRDWIIYHGWDPEHTKRYPRIDPLRVSPEGLFTPGPTDTVQTL